MTDRLEQLSAQVMLNKDRKIMSHSIHDIRLMINESVDTNVTTASIALCMCNEPNSDNILWEIDDNLTLLENIGCQFDNENSYRLCEQFINNQGDDNEKSN